MRTPAFWQRDGLAARLLAPLGTLYDAAGVLRALLTVPRRAGVPVVCIGNATVGGTGKTPVAIDLARRLRARGLAAHLLTRGYGARPPREPLRVNPAKHTFADVGDEPLLLARAAPTWVSPDRVAGAKAAVKAGAQVLVMDDGLQNPRLAKDLALLVVDGGSGFGNGRVLPAGPLREALPRALGRARAVVLIGRDETGARARLPEGLPVLTARLRAAESARYLRGRRVLAFAGIGRPAKFFETVTDLGAELVASAAFPDHHGYAHAEVQALLRRAEAAGAWPVTTEKDAVRLPAWARAEVQTVPVAVAWDDAEALERVLEDVGRNGGA